MDKDQKPDPLDEKRSAGAAGLPDPGRRSLLKAAPLGALAVAAVAGAKEAEAPAPAPAPDENKPRGYHETEHIRRYYRTAAYW